MLLRKRVLVYRNVSANGWYEPKSAFLQVSLAQRIQASFALSKSVPWYTQKPEESA